MSQGEQPISCMLRLSEAVSRLRADGVGEVDMLATIANAALHGPLVATGYRSVVVGGQQQDSADRLPVRRMTWRVIASPKANDKGYSRTINGDELIWSRGDHVDNFVQEAWRSVFVDRMSLEAIQREMAARAPFAKATTEETAAWIAEWPGTDGKQAWQAYQRHFGRRAGKREEDFMPAWKRHTGYRPRGRPKKSPTPSPA